MRLGSNCWLSLKNKISCIIPALAVRKQKTVEVGFMSFVKHSEDKWFHGYVAAVLDFGIWRNGQQTIGCQETPVNEILAKMWKKRYPACGVYGCEGCFGCEGEDWNEVPR